MVIFSAMTFLNLKGGVSKIKLRNKANFCFNTHERKDGQTVEFEKVEFEKAEKRLAWKLFS